MSIYYDVAIISIEKALENIELITDNSKFQSLKLILFDSITNAVQKTNDYYTRIEKASIDNSYDEKLRAFAYLNNQIKHDKSLEIIYFEVCGMIFPFDYPVRYGMPGLFWNNFTDNGSTKARGKRWHYEKHLMNKEIKYTLIDIKEILANINRQYESSK